MAKDDNLRARNAKPKADGTPSRTTFGNGVYLTTTKSGTKTWRCNYEFGKTYRMKVLGYYPAMTPSEALAKRLELRIQVRRGVDPALADQAEKAATIAKQGNTLRFVAQDWLSRASDWEWSDNYAKQVEARMVKYVFRPLGDKPIASIKPLDIQAAIDPVRPLRAQAVHVKQHLQCLFDYAMDLEYVTENVVRKIRKRLLPRRQRNDAREIPRARVETIEEARQVLRAVETAHAGVFLKLAHRLIALTAVRKMEAVDATWNEFDEAKQTWTIPATRMKGRASHQQEHVIPLSPQALEVFLAARKAADRLDINSPQVFPGRSERKALERSSLNDLLTGALASIGLAGKHTVHGWRGTFSTIQNTEEPGADRIIEVMLAHKTKSNVEGRYNTSKYLEARLKIACTWADKLLDGMPSAFQVAEVPSGDNVVPFQREAA